MANYELLILLSEDSSEEAQKSIVGQLQDLIEKNKGSLKDSESWGKKPLAFQIGQSKSGFYWLVNFEGPQTAPKKVNDFLRIESSVLRFILTSAEAPTKVKKPLKKVEPKKKLAETFIR